MFQFFFAALALQSPGADIQPDADHVIQDCPSCPEMAIIEGGMATIGSPKDEKGRHSKEPLQHRVEVQRFAIGRTEITRGQYSKFVSATNHRSDGGCLTPGDAQDLQSDLDPAASWSNAGFAQSNDHPVVCVSRADAMAYANWLSGITGQKYRLPTGIEWEHAARGGKDSAYLWSGDAADGCGFMNSGDLTLGKGFPALAAEYREAFAQGLTTSVLVQCEDGYVFTSPVRSFAANEFGLFDVLGNAWEWVEDCSDEGSVPVVHGTAPQPSTACKRGIVRGGSWDDWPVDLRLADSHRPDSSSRRNDTGFRLARELTEAECSRDGGQQC